MSKPPPKVHLRDRCTYAKRHPTAPNVVEPKRAIRRDPVLKWTWVDSLCSTCARNGLPAFVHERSVVDDG